MDILANNFISAHFDPIGVGTRANAAYVRAIEFDLSRKIFEKLLTTYPGYGWKVKVNAPGGLVSIALPQLMFRTLHYNFALDKLSNDPDMLMVQKAGGELLERFNLRRSKASAAEYRDAIAKRPRVMTRYDHIDGGLAQRPSERALHPSTRKVLLPA